MKRWIIKPTITPEADNALQVYPASIRQLFYNRGIIDEASARVFLQPDFSKLFDPFIFTDMSRTVERIWQAIENKEKICIFGDYDADAVTANAVLRRTFQYLGVESTSYIPDRFSEGYGLNLVAFEKLKNDGVTVCITVDCGTNSIDAAEYCKANGIDLIITDHHEITGAKPNSFALINPKNSSEIYPDNQITGVGVAFKLACGILSDETRVQKYASNFVKGWEKWLLDLVSIGTVADCHSLLLENRILVSYGLKVLQKTKWKGLKKLIELSSRGLEVTYTSQLLGFGLAPRINAAGRLEHANVALDLLLSDNDAECNALSIKLEEINNRRRDLTARIVTEAKEHAWMQENNKVLLLTNPGWHKGVVGLVAGKLANDFGKPTIVLEQGQEFSVGSVRSVGSFDVVEMLKETRDHLHAFGGHKQAAGLTARTEKLQAFHEAILDYADRRLSLEDLQPYLEIEMETSPDEVTLDTARLLELFEPFGAGNPRPLYGFPTAFLSSGRRVGKDGRHIQFKVGSLDGIAFSKPEFLEKCTDTHTPMVAEIMKDVWMGREKVKLKLVDF
ncbi:MAG TPA: single-stranded-DNA-specific exonuclease RecJ [Patescibacteria group bacterium]|nr:single-stranded-DNA-specific exonuclease RecJ [Patescibacteria group bacterium]